jgi:hypothetical protein
VEAARKLQSEHWVSMMATLFISVVGYLKVEEWNKTDGRLAVGAEVTVHGEQAGQPMAPGSHWATVTRAIEDDRYEVTDAAGVATEVARAELRHRVLVQQAFVAMSDDTKHDSPAMQVLSEKELAWLKESGVLEKELISVLAQVLLLLNIPIYRMLPPLYPPNTSHCLCSTRTMLHSTSSARPPSTGSPAA